MDSPPPYYANVPFAYHVDSNCSNISYDVLMDVYTKYIQSIQKYIRGTISPQGKCFEFREYASILNRNVLAQNVKNIRQELNKIHPDVKIDIYYGTTIQVVVYQDKLKDDNLDKQLHIALKNPHKEHRLQLSLPVYMKYKDYLHYGIQAPWRSVEETLSGKTIIMIIIHAIDNDKCAIL